MVTILDEGLPRSRLAILLKHFSQIEDGRQSWRVASEHPMNSASHSEKARQISSLRQRPKLHSITPLSLVTPATWWPRCRSSTGVHGTTAKSRPSSISANRPEVNVRRFAAHAGAKRDDDRLDAVRDRQSARSRPRRWC
jgi:hypothetical protein